MSSSNSHNYLMPKDALPFTVLQLNEQPFFMLTVKHSQKMQCVYSHEIFDGLNPPVMIFIGVSRLNELFSFSDARRNSEWIKFVTPDRPIATRIIAIGDYVDCNNHRAKLIKELQPHCNLRGFDIGSRLPIQCIEDGTFYDTIAEAAKAYGASTSALSNHLHGRPGHRSVKSHTFRRVARDTKEQPT